jgi:Domain of unknown function (DUF4291)
MPKSVDERSAPTPDSRRLEPLTYRSIQIGLAKSAVDLYVNQWIQKMTDITDVAHRIHSVLSDNKLDQAQALLPQERIYPYNW